jgi:hypothetical protein
MPLSVKDGMGAWVDDFKKSDAPQFKGKSEKERREMAIAAYMSAKRGNKNEATDNPPFTPDPPKPKAKNSDGSTTSPMSRARQLARQARDRSKEKDEGYVSHAQRKAVWANRADDGKGHPDKKKNESVEENYNWKVSHGGKDVHVKAPHAGAAVKKAQKGFGNMDLTKAKVSNLGKVGAPTKESVELGENIIAKRAYEIMKPTKSMNHGIEAIKKTMKVDHGTATRLAKQVMDKVKKGEFKESIDEAGSPERYKMIKKAGDKYNKEKKKAERDAKRAMSKDKDMMGEAKLDELSPATHKSYQAKAFTSGAAGMAAKRMGTMSAKDAYDNEKRRHAGIELSKSLQRRDDRKKRNEEVQEERQDTAHHIAKTLRKMGVRHDAKEHEILPKIPHALKKHGLHNNKLIKRDRDFQGNVIDSLRGMKESVQELNKSTLGSYVNKASRDAASKAYGAASAAKDNNTEKGGKDFSKSMKRLRGINTATKKLAKEDTNEAKSFDQKFKDHLKFATSKSPAVQAYMKKRVADRDAMNKKNDPNAAKKGYALSATPPERAYKKARKKGMSASDASQAVGTASRNRGRKLPK